MIMVTGDLHYPIDGKKLIRLYNKIGAQTTKQDYLLVLGDFGAIWEGGKKQEHYLDVLEAYPWTTLFVDGNHENFDCLERYPIVEIFGGAAHKVRSSIFHLMRGEVFKIEDKTILAFGGARSTDRDPKVEYAKSNHGQLGQSVWFQETATITDFANAMRNLKTKCQMTAAGKYQIDLLASHTTSTKHATELRRLLHLSDFPAGCEDYIDMSQPFSDPTESLLETLITKLDFKEWRFGHWHTDHVLEQPEHGRGKITAVYNHIDMLGE